MLKIDGYNKNITKEVFNNWYIIYADELLDEYFFKIQHRFEKHLIVYITLSKKLQQVDIKYPELFYQCYISDEAASWHERIWLEFDSINYKKFWAHIELIVDNHHPILPF